MTLSHGISKSLVRLYIPRFLATFLPSGSDSKKKSACNAGDLGSIPGLRRSPGEGNGYHASILAWRIPWTEEPGGLHSRGLQRVVYD